MHEQHERRGRLPQSPVERMVIEKIAEIVPRRVGGHGGNAARLEMPRERARRKRRIEASGSFGKDHRACRKSAFGIGARRGAVMRRMLDAECLGMLADAEVNHHMGLQRLAEARHERGGLPFGGQDPGVNPRHRVRQWPSLGQRLGKPTRRIRGHAGKRAKAREQDARPLHGSRLTLRLTRAREANLGGSTRRP